MYGKNSSHTLCYRQYLLRFFCVYCRRFFTQYMFACQQGLFCILIMQVIWCADNHKLNIHGQQFFQCFTGMQSFPARFFQLFFRRIINRRNLYRGRLSGKTQMNMSHISKSNDSSLAAGCLPVSFYKDSGGITDDRCIRRHIPRNHRACSHQRMFPDRNPS